ncbi:MAG: DUF2905 domain-containing protein [Peptococcaceae bacterium]|jgi:hypothetical protein|nr:DUF2905 domain-containing protein [Peptococcaceae bacterium]MBQ5658832.1 DUF2905 domain-containing protein [Peptococcaceae bacterium]
MNGTELGKLLIMLGLGAILIGLVIIALSKFISLGNLPGDIIIKGENGGGFYFPVVSCIVISVVLSVIMNLFNR